MFNDLSKGFKSSVSIYLANGVSILTGVLLSIILVRNLSPSDYGIYKLIGSIGVFVGLVTSFGLGAVAIRYIPEFITRKAYWFVNKLSLCIISIRIAALLLCVALFYVFQDNIFSFFNMPHFFHNFFFVIFSIFVIQGLSLILSTISVTSYLEEYKVSINASSLAVITLIVYWYILQAGYGIKSIIISWLILVFLSLLHYICEAAVKFFRNIKYSVNPDRRSMDVKRIFRYGFFGFMTGSVGIFLNIMVDNFVIAHYLGLKLVGTYSLAAVLVVFVGRINPSQALKNVFYPLIVKKYISGGRNIELLKKASDFLTRLSLFITVPAFVGLILMGEKIIIYIYNPEYVCAVNVVTILSLFFLFSSQNRRFLIIAQALEKSELNFGASLLGIYNLVMDIVLVKYFGINGIAIATGSTGLITYIFLWAATKWYLKVDVPFPFNSLFKVMVNIIPMVIFILAIRSFILNVYWLIIVLLVSVAIYLGIATLNKIFSQEERDLMDRVIGRKVWVF